MSEMLAKLTDWVKSHENELFTGALIILITVIAFGLGRLSKIEALREPVIVETASAITTSKGESRPLTPAPERSDGGRVVASKSGTKYHFPWCSGALRISEANKIWFKTKEDAERAGYTPAANCKGL